VRGGLLVVGDESSREVTDLKHPRIPKMEIEDYFIFALQN